MGGEMMAALGRAAVDGHTLFAHRAAGRPGAPLRLGRTSGGAHAPEERVRATHVELAQARRTHAVLGCQPGGSWGYCHGVNEHGVAAGCTRLRTRLRLDAAGLTGPDLVRLALERGQTARQALEALTGLIARHGQGGFPGCPDDEGHDAAVLVADAREAFLVEASGPGWVCQELTEVRAAGDVCTIRQDWDHIAPGLSGRAIERGWWPEDGTKLDFAGALAADVPGPALWHWGRATRLLVEQSGHIDAGFLRRALGGEFDSRGPAPRGAVAASLVAAVGGEVPLAWWALGPAGAAVYLPLLPAGELPPALAGDLAARAARLAADDPAREGLQALLDAEAAEFVAEAAALRRAGRGDELGRQAALFMQHAWEEFAEVTDGPAEPAPQRPDVAVWS